MPLKSLINLWLRIASAFPETDPMSLTHISKCVTSLDYLTKTLPNIGKVLDASLANGGLLSFHAICKTKKGLPWPVFLQEYFSLIFNKGGLVLPHVNPDHIRQLRTLLFLFYKYETPFTEDQLGAAHQKFINTDNSVIDVIPDDVCELRATFSAIMSRIDPLSIRGHHSAGATAGGYNNIERRTIFEVIPSLNRVYDLKYFFQNSSHYTWYKENHPVVTCEPTSRVAFVPKDSRGPRTICIEPHTRMYMQQGLMHELYSTMEHHPLTKGRVNFTDQSINGRLALSASHDHAYATLDLSDASDLVSWELIKTVVPADWLEPLQALRTSHAVLPDGTTVSLKKFAPMGSALCFPIEALLFFAICRTVTDDVYVYGDDIIVPQGSAHDCMLQLERFGLKVNRAKSFIYGDFRESCGIDAFRGSIVTPVRYRKDDLVSVVAFANNISEAFSTEVGEAVISWYESFNSLVIPRLPFSNQRSGAIAFFTDRRYNDILYRRRWNKDLQRHEIKVLCVTNTRGELAPDDWGVLFDSLSESDRETSFSPVVYHDDTFMAPLPLKSESGRFALLRKKCTYQWVQHYAV